MKRLLHSLVFGFCIVHGAGAADWQAQWIGVADPSAPNLWIAYRKTVVLDAVPATVPARAACDSKYWLWINGRLVVFEGQLKRGPTPDGSYCDTGDLAKHLQSGSNTIALLVWHFGRHGFAHNNSGKAGLVFEMDVGGRRVASDASWKAVRHPAFGTTPPPHPNFRLAEANIHFDAAKDMPGWTTPGFDDNAWPAAVELGRPPCAPWGALVERPIPQWRNSGLLEYPNAAELALPRDGGREIVAKLPYNAQVTPWMKLDAPAGLKVVIQTDNYRGGGTENIRAEYLTRAGEQEFESPAWMNGHDVRYIVPAGVKVLGLKYRETGYDADFSGSFTCDDAALNTLWEKSRRTLYITMRDNYMDCPDRERAQWWGDAVNEIGEAFYVFDPQRGPLLARKAMLELAGWQRADGTMYSPVPAGIPGPGGKQDGSWDKELPPQILASVGWYGFWNYYRYTGDRATMAAVYPAVKRYLAVWKLDANGLVEHRKGGWDWTDWGKNIDVPVCDSAWFYLALKGAIPMAKLTGHEDDVVGYAKQMRSIEAAFNKTFWQGQEYRSPGHKGVTDDRAQGIAVVAGLADPAYFPAICSVLERSYEASPYMEKYVLEALYLMGAPDQAVARMKKRWGEQIDSPITTLWEGWGIGAKGYGGGTYNHAWSGGALTMMSQYAAGIEPVEPAYQTWRVRPQPGPLRQIKCVAPTPHGELSVAIVRGEQGTTVDLVAPAGTAGTFDVSGFPPKSFATVTLDGQAMAGPGALPVSAGTHRIVLRK